MKNRNVKVIDEHSIDRNANIMFAFELEGSEYVVYWIERDAESNNVFVSKVLKNLDNTYNMLNIDDEMKKKEISEMVKVLISNSVSDQNDKLSGIITSLPNGKVVKFIDVSFNKEQNINVTKTYITTVKKEVTKVAETYYDVVIEESKINDVLPSAVFPSTPVIEAVPEPMAIQPTPVVNEIVQPVVAPVIEPGQDVHDSVINSQVSPQPVLVSPTINVQPTPVVNNVVQPVVSPVVEPTPVLIQPQAPVNAIVPDPVVVQSSSAVNQVVQPVVAPVVEQPSVIQPVPVVASPDEGVAPVVQENSTLVFNAAKETNLNAALGEVANTTAIPVENIAPVREFGVENPQSASITNVSVAPTSSNQTVNSNVFENNTSSSPKAGFANSKFFMVVAIAFFMASCIFLGYEVYNYFQLVK